MPRPICDFCSSPKVTWSYPAEDFEIIAVPGAGSDGGWAACDICHDLIEAGNRQGLAKRSAYLFAWKHHIPERAVLPQLKRLHKQFFENRTGPAVPVE